jgi:hypothetical protein
MRIASTAQVNDFKWMSVKKAVNKIAYLGSMEAGRAECPT